PPDWRRTPDPDTAETLGTPGPPRCGGSGRGGRRRRRRRGGRGRGAAAVEALEQLRGARNADAERGALLTIDVLLALVLAIALRAGRLMVGRVGHVRHALRERGARGAGDVRFALALAELAVCLGFRSERCVRTR